MFAINDRQVRISVVRSMCCYVLLTSQVQQVATGGNKTEEKTRNEIMDFCQDLDILILVCTIICVLQILCLYVLKKTRNGVPSSRLHGDRHGLIRKPARIFNGRKMDSVQWRISRKQPIEHDEKPF